MDETALLADDEAHIGLAARRAPHGDHVHHASSRARALARITAGARLNPICVDIGLGEMSIDVSLGVQIKPNTVGG